MNLRLLHLVDEEKLLFHCIVQSKQKMTSYVTINPRRFVLPQNSKFIMSDADGLRAYSKTTDEKFQFIVIDPPWENKSVKRKKT